MADQNTLHIVNYFDYAVDVAVTGNDFNCCDAPRPGYVVGHMPSNSTSSMVFLRTDGHGCNGRQGQFQLSFESTMLLNLDFDSGGNIEISNPPSGFGAWMCHNNDGSYTLIVGATPSAN